MDKILKASAKTGTPATSHKHHNFQIEAWWWQLGGMGCYIINSSKCQSNLGQHLQEAEDPTFQNERDAKHQINKGTASESPSQSPDRNHDVKRAGGIK